MRAARPEPEFVISNRTGWDALVDDESKILEEFAAYRDAGVTHLVPEPRQRESSAYMESIQAMAELMTRAGAVFTPSP